MTARETEVYNFIKQFIEENQYSPTIREIAIGVNSASLHFIHDVVCDLKDKGYIKFKTKSARTIRIVK